LSDKSVDSLVTLQERMVNLIKQLNMPLVEVSMVIQNMISPMLESLEIHAKEHEMQIPDKIMNQWPIEKPIHEEVKSSLAIDKLLSVLDQDRMDILETLVRVTMIETEMILLDEPASGLDPRYTKLLKDWIKNLSANGRTILLSTHIIEMAETLCNRIGIIDQGKLMTVGTVNEIQTSTGVRNLEDAFIRLISA